MSRYWFRILLPLQIQRTKIGPCKRLSCCDIIVDLPHKGGDLRWVKAVVRTVEMDIKSDLIAPVRDLLPTFQV